MVDQVTPETSHHAAPAPPPSGIPARASRVVLEDPRPCVDGGRFAAKATIGVPVEVSVDAFTDGHDHLAVLLRWARDGDQGDEIPMTPGVNDRWHGRFVPDRLGRWSYELTGWVDRYATWCWAVRRKLDAGVEVDLDLVEGAELIEAAAHRAGREDAGVLTRAAETLRSGGTRGAWGILDDPRVAELMWRHAERIAVATLDSPVPIWVDRPRASFSSWYELFPRSTVGEAPPATGHGTLTDVVDRLDHIERMGFDVVYLPPVHPIGRTARKGPDNDPAGGPDAVGSPWAIGNEHGGHCSVDPALGTVPDVARLADACRARGMELALDLAFQCSPDHPWVREHPQWFRHRPDGSIHYAENPPKRYQDIYPLDFDSEDWQGLWAALHDVVRFWMAQGVRIFRVDNPHTKPFAFWEWLIDQVRRTDPDVIFLSEAFTRPKVMYRLAKAGFTQSYTYFAWRQQRWELEQYFTELTEPPVVDFFRPNAWPNTPDILTEQLQHGGRPMFLLRAVLAATLAANYGVYGPAFELIEHRAVRPGSEEYLASEKYQVRHWHLDQPNSLAPLLGTLNEVRRRHPALQQDRTLAFHPTSSEDLICYSKRSADGADVVICLVNLSPTERRSGWVHLLAEPLGCQPEEPIEVTDELGGSSYRWTVGANYVDLDPGGLAAHILSVRRRPGERP